jgi:D-3-phosphoglycerate dehydrogenase
MKILLTDAPWGAPSIEEAIYGDAGHQLIAAKSSEEEQLVELARGCQVITTCWAPVTAKVMEAAAPTLRHVARYGVGLDNIDLDYADSHGITVTNVPDYCVDEVADHAFALLLSLARHTARFDRTMRDGRWGPRSTGPISRLQGQVCGIVGLGRIGSAVASRAAAFGLTVHAYDPAIGTTGVAPAGLVMVDLAEVLTGSDFITLHVPLTAQTRQLINDRTLRMMKPTAYLINTARGGLVDGEALVRALEAGQIAGAALDVHDVEPPPPSYPLLRMDNVVLTPHAAFYSEEAVADLQRRVAEAVLQVAAQ